MTERPVRGRAGGEAARSREMVRAHWSAGASEKDLRADLQTRVTTLFALMFWSLTALVGFLWALYSVYDEIAPRQRDIVYAGASVGLAAMAFIWRVLLVRRPLSVEALYRIDLIYSIGIGTAFGAAAYFQRDIRASGYLSLVYSTFTVLARALIVPSSPKRTAVASTLTYLPMTTAALILALYVPEDLPGPAFFLGYLLLSIVPIVLATAGSHIIYGLRRKARAAKQVGLYSLGRRIGEGGMGTVYHAHHIMLRRPTAVKLLLPDRNRPDDLARFAREVHYMSKLTHPNTVTVYDYGHTAEGIFYYAMEYLGAGINLDHLVRTDGPQPTSRIIHILSQVCDALNEAHVNNIIHRDIKPANIVLCERGGMPDVAKVVDYGLVKLLTADTGASAQDVLGTPGYIAPETMTEPDSIGPAVDLYALGAVGYFLVTGRKVFEGKTAFDVCIQHVTKPPTPPSQISAIYISPELEAIIMKCLEKKPADRFASAAMLGKALRALPRTGDWDTAKARQWWKAFDAKERRSATTSESATETMSVDLGAREPEGA